MSNRESCVLVRFRRGSSLQARPQRQVLHGGAASDSLRRSRSRRDARTHGRPVLPDIRGRGSRGWPTGVVVRQVWRSMGLCAWTDAGRVSAIARRDGYGLVCRHMGTSAQADAREGNAAAPSRRPSGSGGYPIVGPTAMPREQHAQAAVHLAPLLTQAGERLASLRIPQPHALACARHNLGAVRGEVTGRGRGISLVFVTLRSSATPLGVCVRCLACGAALFAQRRAISQGNTSASQAALPPCVGQ